MVKKAKMTLGEKKATLSSYSMTLSRDLFMEEIYITKISLFF